MAYSIYLNYECSWACWTLWFISRISKFKCSFIVIRLEDSLSMPAVYRIGRDVSLPCLLLLTDIDSWGQGSALVSNFKGLKRGVFLSSVLLSKTQNWEISPAISLWSLIGLLVRVYRVIPLLVESLPHIPPFWSASDCSLQTLLRHGYALWHWRRQSLAKAITVLEPSNLIWLNLWPEVYSTVL